MSNPLYEYNPIAHITVKELRAIGFEVPGTIPDGAFISRSSAKFDVGTRSTDGNLCGASFQIYMSQPFRWIEQDLHLKDETVKKVSPTR